MYGLKPDDIVFLKGTLLRAELIQVCVGQSDLQFRFEPTENVSVWGRCELINEAGEVAEVWPKENKSQSFLFLDLLGSTVTDVAIDTPKSLSLVFSSGLTLRVVDDSECFESFSVGNLIV